MAKRKPSTVQRLLTTPRRTSLKPASKEPSLESLVSWCGSSSRICKPMLIRENLCSSHWSIGQFSVHHRLSFMKNLINALVTTFLSQTKKKSAKTNAPITFQHLERLSYLGQEPSRPSHQLEKVVNRQNLGRTYDRLSFMGFFLRLGRSDGPARWMQHS